MRRSPSLHRACLSLFVIHILYTVVHKDCNKIFSGLLRGACKLPWIQVQLCVEYSWRYVLWLHIFILMSSGVSFEISGSALKHSRNGWGLNIHYYGGVQSLQGFLNIRWMNLRYNCETVQFVIHNETISWNKLNIQRWSLPIAVWSDQKPQPQLLDSRCGEGSIKRRREKKGKTC